MLCGVGGPAAADPFAAPTPDELGAFPVQLDNEPDFSGNYRTIRGSVRNNGTTSSTVLDGHRAIHGQAGSIVDTQITNSGQGLAPGAEERFDIMSRPPDSMVNYRVYVDQVSFAD